VLSAPTAKRILAALAERIDEDSECVYCGETGRSLVNDFVTMLANADPRKVDKFESRVVTVGITCDGCGHLDFWPLAQLGLADLLEENKPNRAARRTPAKKAANRR
jgi:hypothetical protein